MLQSLSVPAVICSKSKDLFEAIKDLRKRVWEGEGADLNPTESRNMIHDSVDDDAFHYSVIIEGQLVAAARMSIHRTLSTLPDSSHLASFIRNFDLPAASFNRMVVDPAYRGMGLPNLLDLARLKTLLSLEIRSAVAMAVSKRVRSMADIGFSSLGKVPKTDEFMHSISSDFHCLYFAIQDSKVNVEKKFRFPPVFALPTGER